MSNVPFGGPLGTLRDKVSGRQVKVRCSGTASVTFEAPDDFKAPARASLIKHTGAEIQRMLDAGTSLFSLIHGSPALIAAVSGAASAELGPPIQVSTISLGMSDDDAQALAAVAVAAPTGRACPRCGTPGAGKFCAGCGSPMVT